MFIEIKQYADFDMLVTKYVMYSQAHNDAKELLVNFTKEMNLNGKYHTKEEKEEKEQFDFILKDGLSINENSISNLTGKELNGIEDNFYMFLKKLGFVEIETTKISFSD